ncbi:MAG TPA: diguanylate cyclase [Pseudomonadota bacterium]|jgi:diguanylate cyclase (GGDEF)-like protein|nr:diguanylate cyclase [Pseudomonadota bacterium]
MTSKPLAVMRSPMRLQVAARWVLAASLVWMLSAVQVMAATLSLDDTLRVHDAWPHVRVLSDPERRIAADEALQRLPEFKPPASPHAGMGFRNDALWFHLPVAVPADSDGRWVLEIDYALLNRVEVFVARAGRTEHAATMGSLLPFRDRPLGSRTPAVMLDLPRGQTTDILFRIDTRSSVIVPVKLLKPAAFHARANHEFLLQGVLVAIGLCLLAFSVQQWINLKDAVYGKYAAVIVCHVIFNMHLFGLGAIYLWTDRPWIEVHMAGVSLLMVSATLALFVEAVLGGDLHPRARLGLKALATLLALFALLFALDWMNNRWLGVVSAVFGLMPALIGLQGAMARVRRGDAVGTYFIVAWTGYFLTGVVLSLTINGHIGANFWSLHALQFGATFDMLLFMRIVILRTAAEHRVAQQARHERDMLKLLAHTDSLTGLKNRRGLNEALATLIPGATPQRMLALYMLDLDGFKPVNDQYGHDIGDELLVAIARRLSAALRANDIVARVGGDEFVVLATDLASESAAAELGDTLLAAFRTPFRQGDHDCRVGATIGYVLVPDDGTAIGALLKAADAAMYAGKQAGKGVAVRGTRSL